MPVNFFKILVRLFVLTLFTSCYEYNDYEVINIVSTYNNQQVIRKSLNPQAQDGYFSYKNDSNSVEQPLLNSENNQHIGICAIDCNEKLHPIIWSPDGNSFILHFYNSNHYKLTPLGERLYVFRIVDGVVNNIHQVLDKKIIETFYSDNNFNYITSEKPDTIKIEHKIDNHLVELNEVVAVETFTAPIAGNKANKRKKK